MAEEIYHHGIRGQKWGVRHGPPYPLEGGSFTKTRQKNHDHGAIAKKKHEDKTITTKDILSTLSYNPDRTKDADMFYTAFTKRDKVQYRALFNQKISDATGSYFKYKIENKVTNDVKVASEDSGAKAFKELYNKSRDFYNFVTDPQRMQAAFDKKRYGFKGYREAAEALDKIRKGAQRITDKDVSTVYRMFNYIIPYESADNPTLTKDVKTQRTRLFSELSKEGYGALLDTNDALYGRYHAEAPTIVFDMSSIIPSSVKATNMADKTLASLEFAGRKLLGR